MPYLHAACTSCFECAYNFSDDEQHPGRRNVRLALDNSQQISNDSSRSKITAYTWTFVRQRINPLRTDGMPSCHFKVVHSIQEMLKYKLVQVEQSRSARYQTSVNTRPTRA
jgi:hypothetical protein